MYIQHLLQLIIVTLQKILMQVHIRMLDQTARFTRMLKLGILQC